MSACAVRVEEHLPLARYLSRRYLLRASLGGLTIDDLAQEGAIALMRAARRFEPAKGIAFSTYAGVAIRRRLLMCMEKLRPLQGLPPLPGEDGEDLTDVVDPREPPDQDAPDAVEHLLEILRPVERRMVEMRFGLGGQQQKEAKEIARELGCKPQWVYLVLARGLRRMRDYAGSPDATPTAGTEVGADLAAAPTV
jgi:RNA polymerase sporulation-specific sigma factor